MAGPSLGYLYLLALAAVRARPMSSWPAPCHRFAIAIPAHDEEEVIGRSVATLFRLDYPPELFDVHVVADHCTDRTAEVARAAGALVHERSEAPRGSKGAALRWLFSRILDHEPYRSVPSPYDAVVIFDADTQVDTHFLRVMNARLVQGDQAIQGQHRISNPDDGWFPLLTWAMFIIDNRYQNLGRTNLGGSAKHMGDSICFRADVLRRLGWGDGLTEDYAFRQRLLLDGILIAYEPTAVGYGEAAVSWTVARAQRTRWLRGTHDASQHYAGELLREALRRRDLALLDGALQAFLPSYSTSTLICSMAALLGIVSRPGESFEGARKFHGSCPAWVQLLSLFMYPFLGLALERAPLKAYVAMSLGPFFIVWRTWLALTTRFGSEMVGWVRTPPPDRSRQSPLDESRLGPGQKRCGRRSSESGAFPNGNLTYFKCTR